MKALEWSQHFSRYKSLGIFSDAQAQLTLWIWPKFELIQAFLLFLLTCKNEDPIKNQNARVVTKLYTNLRHSREDNSVELVVGAGENLNSFKLLCMSSLPARMKKI